MIRRILRAIAHSRPAIWHARRLRHRLPVYDFIDTGLGAEYGVTREDRRKLVERIDLNTRSIESATGTSVHLALASAVLSMPRTVEGCLVECGCFKGSSTATLSLLADMTGRDLIACDSFEGLPDDGGERHESMHTGGFGYYRAGMFAGRLDEVRSAVERFGAPGRVDYLAGWFSDTLPRLTAPIALAFLDVDLVSSMRDCLRYLWPLVSDGGSIYTDDALDMACCKVFFDDAWWREVHGIDAPGLVGAGCGIAPQTPTVGYVRRAACMNRSAHLYYPDAHSDTPTSAAK